MASLKDKITSNSPKVLSRPFVLSMGPQRAGTSWLDRYLRTRGDVALPEGVKEVFYFDRNYERGIDFYDTHFEPEDQHKTLMEISTTSFDYKEAPERVHRVFGKDVKLLCPLRHPVLRSYSLYLHYLRYGIVHGTLREACFQNPQILESSHYAKHLKNWQSYFDKDQITVVFQEDLENNQDEYVKTVCEAIGVDYIPVPEDISQRYNVMTYSKSGFIAKMAQDVADWLRKRRLYFVINFAKAIGLKRLIFGVENPEARKTDISPADREWLEDQLQDQIALLEEMIGPIPQWNQE